ncbi:hypothetical protein [Rhizobium sullae]|uniref:hypothetical protein n=1 Tax=Rhizobium sullae TaxID=50338 RepID=UPI00140501DE|nr:hypothetical protein [Rhizobium sullae]
MRRFGLLQRRVRPLGFQQSFGTQSSLDVGAHQNTLDQRNVGANECKTRSRAVSEEQFEVNFLTPRRRGATPARVAAGWPGYRRDHNGNETDEQGTIGFDPPLRTFFLQGFPHPETDECALWFGAFLEEYPTLESIIEKARAAGYEVRGLTREMMGDDQGIRLLHRSQVQSPRCVQ